MLLTSLDVLFQNDAPPTLQEFSSFFQDLTVEELMRQFYKNLLAYSEWKRIVEESNDGFYIADGNGVCVYTNKAYREMSGLTQEETKRLPPEDLEKRQYVDKSCILLVRKSKRATTIEASFYRTGKKCLVTCKPLLDKNGEIALMIGSIRDMTEINNLREEGTKNKTLIAQYKCEIENLKKQVLSNGELIAEDPVTLNVLRAVQKIASADSSVVLTGETGVGKEIFAKYIHNNSPRNTGPFIKINCSTIAENLFESELFGYERGAFTGAKNEGKRGLFEAANGGTIFLDEIGELPLNMQAKLLRVLQEREFTRVGGTRPIKIDVRVISATNRDLHQMIEKRLFRTDLYYRLNVIPIFIPPLRQRPGDILPLVEHFQAEMNKKYNCKKMFSQEALMAIQDYSWPGNIRELRNVVERVLIISDGPIIGLHEFEAIQFQTVINEPSVSAIDLQERLRRIEYGYMQNAYQSHGNMKDAALAVGMKRSTFAGKFKMYQEQYGINSPFSE